MRVLVVNTGSSSLKLGVLVDDERLASTTVERWEGEDLEPLQAFLDAHGPVDAVGHRIVHGGPRLTEATLIDDAVIDELAALAELAPLHNPRGVAAIRAVRSVLDPLPEVACFDTAFHSGLPAAARTYALPREWNQQWQLRRYGFHGLSHAYAVRRAAELVGRPLAQLRVVSCHLGAGASLAAVVGGRSVDTTMGFTPLEGLVMATRVGSVDPGLVIWLLRHGGVDVEELDRALAHDSGLRGLSGTSGDVRDVLAGREAGDRDATLAFDVFVHRLRREIGAMAASAGGLDVLVLTGGVGEHATAVRAAALDGLGHLGVRLDHAANDATTTDGEIGTTDAPVRTVVVTASEDIEVARQTRQALSRPDGG